MITTNEITLDQKTFFNVLLRLNFKLKTQLLYAIALILVAVWLILYPYQTQIYVLLAAIVIFPLLILFLTWRTSKNSMNQHFMTTRYYTISSGEITAHLKNGEEEKFSIVHPQKVIRTKKYYLVFTTAIEFLYLPYEAFRTEEDMEWFESEVVKRARKVVGSRPRK